jgi:hypothetical protein
MIDDGKEEVKEDEVDNMSLMSNMDYEGHYSANDFSIQDRMMHILNGDQIDNYKKGKMRRFLFLLKQGLQLWTK